MWPADRVLKTAADPWAVMARCPAVAAEAADAAIRPPVSARPAVAAPVAASSPFLCSFIGCVPSLVGPARGPNYPGSGWMSVSAISNGRIRRSGGATGMVDDALARGGDDRHGR